MAFHIGGGSETHIMLDRYRENTGRENEHLAVTGNYVRKTGKHFIFDTGISSSELIQNCMLLSCYESRLM
jgi:hypothetical protein